MSFESLISPITPFLKNEPHSAGMETTTVAECRQHTLCLHLHELAAAYKSTSLRPVSNIHHKDYNHTDSSSNPARQNFVNFLPSSVSSVGSAGFSPTTVNTTELSSQVSQMTDQANSNPQLSEANFPQAPSSNDEQPTQMISAHLDRSTFTEPVIDAPHQQDTNNNIQQSEYHRQFSQSPVSPPYEVRNDLQQASQPSISRARRSLNFEEASHLAHPNNLYRMNRPNSGMPERTAGNPHYQYSAEEAFLGQHASLNASRYSVSQLNSEAEFTTNLKPRPIHLPSIPQEFEPQPNSMLQHEHEHSEDPHPIFVSGLSPLYDVESETISKPCSSESATTINYCPSVCNSSKCVGGPDAPMYPSYTHHSTSTTWEHDTNHNLNLYSQTSSYKQIASQFALQKYHPKLAADRPNNQDVQLPTAQSLNSSQNSPATFNDSPATTATLSPNMSAQSSPKAQITMNSSQKIKRVGSCASSSSSISSPSPCSSTGTSTTTSPMAPLKSWCAFGFPQPDENDPPLELTLNKTSSDFAVFLHNVNNRFKTARMEGVQLGPDQSVDPHFTYPSLHPHHEYPSSLVNVGPHTILPFPNQTGPTLSSPFGQLFQSVSGLPPQLHLHQRRFQSSSAEHGTSDICTSKPNESKLLTHTSALNVDTGALSSIPSCPFQDCNNDAIDSAMARHFGFPPVTSSVRSTSSTTISSMEARLNPSLLPRLLSSSVTSSQPLVSHWGLQPSITPNSQSIIAYSQHQLDHPHHPQQSLEHHSDGHHEILERSNLNANIEDDHAAMNSISLSSLGNPECHNALNSNYPCADGFAPVEAKIYNMVCNDGESEDEEKGQKEGGEEQEEDQDVNNHEKRLHICNFPDCNRAFKRLEHLKRHYKMHSGDRPFLCAICLKRFSRSDNFRQHQLTHERFNTFLIPHASVAPVRPRAPRVRRPPPQNAPDYHYCNVEGCTKRFKRIEHLKRHKIVHTGEKPFMCPLCEKRFGRSDNFHQHVATHLRLNRRRRNIEMLPQ